MKTHSEQHWVDTLIDSYYSWLRDRTGYRVDGTTGWSIISTPYFGLFNDSIDIYVKTIDNSGKLLLSDDGETVGGLSDLGININRSTHRRTWVNNVLLNYGINEKDGELTVETTIENFPQAKHNLISAILSILDLQVTGKENVTSMFSEKVETYLKESDIVFTPQFMARGKTGLAFTFDYQMAGKEQETIIKPFNSLTKNNVSLFLFGWDDIRETRETLSGKSLNALALIDDVNKTCKEENLSALTNRGAECLFWSEKDTPSFLQTIKRLAS